MKRNRRTQNRWLGPLLLFSLFFCTVQSWYCGRQIPRARVSGADSSRDLRWGVEAAVYFYIFTSCLVEDGTFTPPSWVRTMRDLSRFDVNSEYASWYHIVRLSKCRECEILEWNRAVIVLHWARSGRQFVAQAVMKSGAVDSTIPFPPATCRLSPAFCRPN